MATDFSCASYQDSVKFWKALHVYTALELIAHLYSAPLRFLLRGVSIEVITGIIDE